MKVYVFRRLEIVEGQPTVEEHVCGSMTKAQEMYQEAKASVLSEYVYEGDKKGVDYNIEETILHCSISFPHEETKIVIDIEEQKVIEDEEADWKEKVRSAWKVLDVEQECVFDTMKDCFEECSVKDIKLLEALTICKDYIRDIMED